MSYCEDVPLCPFGTPLEPLEEDEVPSKKRVAIEDQIVTDENGKRRFHGAFTGGFSAGFWNTVGSLEGWKPQSFKSSRAEKAEKRSRQLPTDFMDDEDLGEFGIAPQRVQTREDFAKSDDSLSAKRKLASSHSGPIPGIPVLQQLLEPAREKVASRLLRRMGWKPGQGIGARQTKSEKAKCNYQNNRELYVLKMYGCTANPSENDVSKCSFQQDSDESGDDLDDLTFAPDDFEPFVCSVKDNVFGIGYSGLFGQVAGEKKCHINLFGPLEVMGKTNKKLSIRGQAFGVGALEEEDEDIYERDDMTKYDFSLEHKKTHKKAKLTQDQFVLKGFAEPIKNEDKQKTVHVIELKANFQPRNWSQRKSRFEPLDEEKMTLLKKTDAFKKRGLGRHDLNPIERGDILDEKSKKASTEGKSYLQHISEKYKEREEKSKQLLKVLSFKEDNFVKGGLILSSGVEVMQKSEVNDSFTSKNTKIISEAKEITKSLGPSKEIFRPFASNESKQERYEKFIEANLKKQDEIKSFLDTIQPLNLSDWDKEMEMKEFIQAQRIYRPLDGMMSERFVPKTNEYISPALEKVTGEKIKVVVTRVKVLWKPSAVICKRFNVPEPFGGTLVEAKDSKKPKFSVFDYIESSVNSKKDFVTPVIIPKHIEKPKAIQKDNIQVVSELPSSTDTIILKPENVLTKAGGDIKPLVPTLKETSKPKTELELKIEQSKHKHPSEKKDLFKCIFESSDEEDQTDENVKDLEENIESIPKDVEQLLVKPSSSVNILRNNSPPRGIFAALLAKPEEKNESKKPDNLTQNLNKITFKPKNERIEKSDSIEAEHTYGPKIPEDFNLQSSTNTNMKKNDDVDKRLLELLSIKSRDGSKIVEKWIEKKSKSLKKSKKEKKKNQKEKVSIKHKKSKKHKKDKK